MTRIAALAPSGERLIMVMLPGAHQRGEEFVSRGMVAAAQARERRLEVWIAAPGLGAYLDAAVVPLLHDALAPARQAGARLWLAGLSLGGLGALEYARAHPAAVAGVLLVAPFLATRGAVAEISRAGGLAAWRPGSGGVSGAERSLLEWLGSARLDAPDVPAIHAGYGTMDRYAPTGRLLAQRLPPGRVVTARGDHDWPTWQILWRRMLAIAAIRMVQSGVSPAGGT